MTHKLRRSAVDHEGHPLVVGLVIDECLLMRSERCLQRGQGFRLHLDQLGSQASLDSFQRCFVQANHLGEALTDAPAVGIVVQELVIEPGKLLTNDGAAFSSGLFLLTCYVLFNGAQETLQEHTRPRPLNDGESVGQRLFCRRWIIDQGEHPVGVEGRLVVEKRRAEFFQWKQRTLSLDRFHCLLKEATRVNEIAPLPRQQAACMQNLQREVRIEERRLGGRCGVGQPLFSLAELLACSSQIAPLQGEAAGQQCSLAACE
jgi:hypothetical protein